MLDTRRRCRYLMLDGHYRVVNGFDYFTASLVECVPFLFCFFFSRSNACSNDIRVIRGTVLTRWNDVPVVRCAARCLTRTRTKNPRFRKPIGFTLHTWNDRNSRIVTVVCNAWKQNWSLDVAQNRCTMDKIFFDFLRGFRTFLYYRQNESISKNLIYMINAVRICWKFLRFFCTSHNASVCIWLEVETSKQWRISNYRLSR